MVDGASEPYSAWGQMFPYFFQPGKVAIVNLAESGETLSSFIGARRFEKLLSLMKPGDYAFVEFGHNDQKQKGQGIGAFTSYKKDLEYFIDAVKRKAVSRWWLHPYNGGVSTVAAGSWKPWVIILQRGA